MSNNLSIYVKDIADAIRTKTGSSSLIDPQDFSTEIANIPSGGTSKLPQFIERTATTITAEDFAGVTSIGDYAFYYFSSLTSITIPDSVTSIGGSALYGCSSLTSITIPDGVTSIGRYAFSLCSSLTSITIPDGVTSIGDNAFYGCSGLTGSITIPYGVTSIGNQTFRNCSSLTSVTIGSGVTSMGDQAFGNCSSLTSVYYTGDIASWCGISFYNYSSNPLYYAHNLYINNTLVTEITIPDTVTEIKAYAFYGWNGTSVTIPDSVTSIRGLSFAGCSSLTSITVLRNSPPTLEKSAFNSTNNCPIYVPSASVSAYKAASGWSSLSSRIQAIPS